MAKLTIVAHVTAKADKIDLVKAELEKLIDITRAEEGCLQYDLNQDNENPAHFKSLCRCFIPECFSWPFFCFPRLAGVGRANTFRHEVYSAADGGY